MQFDFLISRRPVSLQTKNRRNLQAWKAYVRGEAEKEWGNKTAVATDIHLTLVYLFDSDPVDVDNIIKPIQDALVGLVYEDDALVTDVESHRRLRFGEFDISRLPDLLLQGIESGEECVYVRVVEAKALEDYL